MSGDEDLPSGGGRRRRRSPAPAPPLDNDDLLSDILLRLPPSPSSLPRASLVCKRWRRLVSAPAFIRSFRARHRGNAPLLGFITEGESSLSFTSTMEPPDRLPRGHFSLELEGRRRVLGCRHGLVLTLNRIDRYFLVWEPVSGEMSRVAFPTELCDGGSPLYQHGAVLRAPGDFHAGEDFSTLFLVVLVGSNSACTRACACVYSSATGVWGNLVSTACPSKVPMYINPSTLIGSSLYWMLGPTMAILKFDLDRQFLVVIDAPLPNCQYAMFRHWIMPAEGGGLGLLCLSDSDYNAHLWMWKMDCDGISGWVLGRTIELDKFHCLNSREDFPPMIVGFAEEDNMSFLMIANGGDIGGIMVKLDSTQFKKSFGLKTIGIHHPLASVYTAGIGIGGGQARAELLDNT